eukprot:scaffold28929_cov29-Prasinocladus_malaysianus.AAC.3
MSGLSVQSPALTLSRLGLPYDYACSDGAPTRVPADPREIPRITTCLSAGGGAAEAGHTVRTGANAAHRGSYDTRSYDNRMLYS